MQPSAGLDVSRSVNLERTPGGLKSPENRDRRSGGVGRWTGPTQRLVSGPDPCQERWARAFGPDAKAQRLPTDDARVTELKRYSAWFRAKVAR